MNSTAVRSVVKLTVVIWLILLAILMDRSFYRSTQDCQLPRTVSLKPWMSDPAALANNDITSTEQNRDDISSDDWAIESEENLRELNEFKNFMNGTNRTKSAVYILAENTKRRIDMLRDSIQSLHRHFLKQYNYPVIIFHDQLNSSTQQAVRAFAPIKVFFQKVRFSLPIDKLIEPLVPKLDSCTHRPLSYRHMCRFNALKVFEQPIFKYIEYYWRLDTDSKILRDIPYDIFEKMAVGKKIYGHTFQRLDLATCVYGLWKASKAYISANNIKPEWFHELPDRTSFYNNFEISKVEFWRRSEVKKFLNHIDGLGGIYYLRWGDSPIHSIVISIFAKRTETVYFDDIGYYHDGMLIRP